MRCASKWSCLLRSGHRMISTEAGVEAGLQELSKRAQVSLEQERYFRALGEAEQALVLDPWHTDSWQTRITALWRTHQYRSARKLLQESQVHVPDLLELSLVLEEQSLLGTHDLSKFYTEGCRSEQAPELADFIGPVEVKVTPDGRGRGMFVTRDVQCGDLLLVSNAIARVDRSHGDPSQLLEKVLKACSDSSRTRAQVYSMAEPSTESCKMIEKEAPSMQVFRPNWSNFDDIEQTVDISRIQGIIDCSRECGVDCVGLWTLPSFINHCCLPNACVRKFGRALLVFAAREMKQGEEMVRAYRYCLQPKVLRLSNDTKGSFVCKCTRCTLEETLATQLAGITEAYLKLLSDKVEVGHPDLVDVAWELLKVEAADREAQQWLMAAYPLAFHSLVTRLNASELECFADKAMEAFQETAPGDTMTLKTLLFYSRFASRQGLRFLQRECLACYGRSINHETYRAIVNHAFAGRIQSTA